MDKVVIVPAILATTEDEYKEKLERIQACAEPFGPELRVEGLAEGWIQIDLMDSKFVQNKSIGPQVIAKYPTNLRLEAHLMVEYPENWIDDLVKISNVQRIIFPVEDVEGIEERIKHIRNHGKEVGLGLNPETSLERVQPYLDDIDVVLLLSVHPGFQAQELIPGTLEKIKECSRMRLSRAKSRDSNNNYSSSGARSFLIEVDGGISEENVKQVVDAGADYLVIGSGLFKYDNLEEGLEKIWEALRSG